MKKLRFSSRPSQSKSLAHGATGNCQRIALVSAVSLPKKSASYLIRTKQIWCLFKLSLLFSINFKVLKKPASKLSMSSGSEENHKFPVRVRSKAFTLACPFACRSWVSSQDVPQMESAVCGLVQSCDVCVLEKLALGNIGWSQIVSFSKITWRTT